MSDILLTTLNAKYIHAAFGLRYLMANLGPLRERAAIAEFDINQRPIDVAEAILAHQARIVGMGIYIWNVRQATELVAILKRLRPELIIILGGPEVSFEFDEQEIVRLADHVITGEADLKFAETCQNLLEGDSAAPTQLPRIIAAELPDPSRLELPYDLYNKEDAAHRVIYVEASRGCPFSCEFCLSSLDIPVRQFPLDRLLPALDAMIQRGATQFKFVDRTFNLNSNVACAILQFFLDRWKPGLFVHFEMVPDRLPPALRGLIARFPRGSLQFEVGVQTLNPDVEKLISRRQDHARLTENLTWLREETGVHLHVDLIAGLPGESLESFAKGFDQLSSLRPHEIQVGILKRLRGTPISRHDAEWRMTYHSSPPYEVLQTRDLDFNVIQSLRRFARYWDLFGNSGNFVESLPLLLNGDAEGSGDSQENAERSPFWRFWRFCEWLREKGAGTTGIALTRQFALLHGYLRQQQGIANSTAISALARDYKRTGRSDAPRWLQGDEDGVALAHTAGTNPQGPPRRQARHLAGN